MKPKLIIFSAPSGAGKTTIVKEAHKTVLNYIGKKVNEKK